jgi:hypothetical protein
VIRDIALLPLQLILSSYHISSMAAESPRRFAVAPLLDLRGGWLGEKEAADASD